MRPDSLRVDGPQVTATPTGRPRHPADGDDRRAPPADDVAHLQELIDAMRRHASPAADERELALVAGAMSASTAEQHLRAIGALLATLHTYLRGRRPDGSGAEPRRDGPAPAPAATAAPDPALAAAAACYIARDLAARRLSEFTSAEGYRLARTLARIGDVEASVEQLLVEANTLRLHPPRLTDAVSHSAG